MKRSAGVTVIAVLSLIGSVLFLLMGIVMCAVMVFAPMPSSQEFPAPPAIFKLMIAGAALAYGLPAVWGIITSVGLFRLAKWARISIIVFSTLLVLISGCAALGMLLIRIPASAGPVDPSVSAAFFRFMGAFWLGLMGIGIWWLVFFTRPGVKQQFAASRSPVPPPSPEMPAIQGLGGPLPDVVQPAPRQRPLSFTIIAGLLLIGALFLPLNLLMHPPAIFLTRVVTGWPATLYYVVLTALNGYIGIGLLRFKPVARKIAVGYFVAVFINSAIFYLAPGGRARLQGLMDAQQEMFPWLRAWQGNPQFQIDLTPMLWFGGAVGLAFVLVPLYFLITRKRRFEEAAKISA